jgi:hypothetical protein
VSTGSISCIPRPGATPDSSRAAVAHCYSYLVERRQLRKQKKATRPGAPEDARKDQDARTMHIIPE